MSGSRRTWLELLLDGETPDWASLEKVLGPESPELARARRTAQLCQALADSRQQGPEHAPDHLPDQAITFRWGHLEVRNQIGHGSSGTVYRAFDTVLERDVALKLLDDSPIRARAFIAEARRLAQVRHANVLAVYGAAVHDGRAGLWSDLINGLSLDQWIEANGPRPAADLLDLARSLASALEAVHAAGLVHGDVKPGNILRETGSNRIVLMDFGSAGDHEFAARHGLLGSPASMAPEQVRGGSVGPAADIYGLGVVLFHAASGRYPPAADIDDGSEAATVIGRLALPRALRRLMHQMLAREPENRPRASTVVRRLEYIAGAPQRRRRHLAVAATVSGLALGLVASLYALQQVQAERRFAEAAHVKQAAVSDFLGDVLAAPQQRGADIRVRDVLDHAVSTVHRRFEAHPAAQIEVLHVIGRSYLNLGLQPQARSALSEALALSNPIHGRDAEISLDLESTLGAIARTLDPPDQAQAMLEDVLSRAETSLGPEHRLPLYLLFQLGSLHLAHQRADQARELFALILERGPAQNLEAQIWEHRAMLRLATIKLNEGRHDDARALFSKVAALVGDAPTEPALIVSLVGARMGLASVAVQRSDMVTAERKYIELLEQIEFSQGEDHANLRINLLNLGGVLNWQHKYAEAIPYLERALALCRLHEPPGTRVWQGVKTNLANALAHSGDLERAREMRQNAFSVSRDVMGEDHRSTLLAQTNLAEQYVLDGDGEAAEEMALDAAARAARVFNPDHVYVLQADTIVARARFVQGQHDEAIEKLLQVCASMTEHLGDQSVYTLNCQQTLAEFLTESTSQ